MTRSEGVVGGLQQREAGDAPSTALLFADHQPVGMEAPAGVQVEVEHWAETGGGERTRQRKREEEGKGGGEEDVRVEGRQRDRCIQKMT